MSRSPRSKSDIRRINSLRGLPLNDGIENFEAGVKLVKLAEQFAINAHGNQRYGAHPYSYHLGAVQRVLGRFGFGNDVVLVASGWLHDCVEDTGISIDEIERLFGPNVSDIVHRVTDEPGVNRKERKAKTYPKIRGHQQATIVKLADRIANVEASKSEPNKFSMYQREHLEFRAHVYVAGLADEMWSYLDNILA